MDWDHASWSGEGGIVFYWKGIPSEYAVDLPIPSQPAAPSATGEQEMRILATRLYELLTTSSKPCWYFILHGGTQVCCGEERVSQVREQIQAARESGEPTGFPLPANEVAAILSEEREGVPCDGH